MPEVGDALAYLSNALWLGLAFLAVRLWQRYRTPAAAWLAGAFCVIAAVLTLGFVVDVFVGDDDPPLLVTELSAAILLTFPYLLFRFGESLHDTDRRLIRAADVVLVLTLVSAFLVGEAPDEGEPMSTTYTVWLVFVLGQWVGFTALTAWRLFRQSRLLPSITRHRLRMIASAAVLLVVTLLVSVVAGGGEDETPGVAQIVSQLMAVTAGAIFLLAFAPPPPLREMWRRGESMQLSAMMQALVAARSPRDITSVVLPAVEGLLASSRVELRDLDGELVDAVGHPGDAERPPDRTAEMGNGVLLLWTPASSPVFGEEEVRIFDRIAALCDLALERLAASGREEVERIRANAMDSELQTIVSTVSHDLKNPLMAIRGFADLLRSDTLDADERAHLIERIAQNAGYMNELIQHLLEFTRIGRSQERAVEVDLSAVAAEIAAGVQAVHEDVTIEVGDLPRVWMPRMRIRQLLENLLGNAVKYGGRPDLTVRIESVESHDWVAVHVRDDGVGVPEGDAARIFDLFERGSTSRGEEGTGLGLAISRKIMRNAGGDLVYDGPGISGRGATFTLRFRRALVHEDDLRLDDGAAPVLISR